MPDDAPNYFHFYPNDFVSDRNVEAMTTEEVGAYILLLCKAWREKPVGTVPNDDRILARWARVSDAKWEKIKPAVMAAFRAKNGERFTQKRLQKEFTRVKSYFQKIREAGRLGGLNKAKNRREHDSSDAVATLEHRSSSTVSSSTVSSVHNKKRSTAGPRKRGDHYVFRIEEHLQGHDVAEFNFVVSHIEAKLSQKKEMPITLTDAEKALVVSVWGNGPEYLMAFFDCWLEPEPEGLKKFAREAKWSLAGWRHAIPQLRDDSRAKALSNHYRNALPGEFS
jgi:uncharacterized protein YdaU (DUF1376 family)